MSIDHWQKEKQKTTARVRTTSSLGALAISAVIVLSSIAAAQLMSTNNNSVAYAQSSGDPSISADCSNSGGRIWFASFTVSNLDPESTWIVQATYTPPFGSSQVTQLAQVESGMTLSYPAEPGTSATFNLYEDVDNDFATVGLESDELVATATTLCVPDPNAPVISAEDMTVVATSSAGAMVKYTVTATDDVDGTATLEEDGTTVTQDDVGGDIAISCSPASGSTFPIGTTTVNCEATDVAENVGTGSFTVTVNPAPDTTAPVFTLVPEDMTVVATSSAGAVVSFEVSAQDDADGIVPVECTPASGNLFPIGTTTVTCTATDRAGNTSTASFTVTVNPAPDTTAPVITVPEGGITAEATSAAGAVVSFEVTAQDDVDGTVTLAEDGTVTQDDVGGDIAISCSPASGSTFPIPIGSKKFTVTCTAVDAAGNTATASFRVIVADTTPPVISAEDITVEATSAEGAVVGYEVTAVDVVDGAVQVRCDYSSGSTFPIGTTTVTCTATDAAFNTARASFTVTVTDTSSPVITVPEDMVVGATIDQGAAVSYTATATDAVDGDSVSVTCTPESGSIFPIGTTTVTCTAVDAAGNEGTAQFTVTVTDTSSPVITGVPADITVEATSSSGGATVSYATPTATDAVDGPVPVTCSPESGSTFPIGTTTVECTAVDAAGNTSTASFTVTVNPAPTDTTAPVITIPEGGITTVAPSGEEGAVVSFEEQVSAEDDVDGTVDVTCTPASGSTFPIGTTTVNCEATDAAGNVGTALFIVTVNPAPDTTAPDVEITGAVDRSGRAITDDGTTPTNYIRITFEATDEVGIDNIGCSLDGGEEEDFASCTSPVVYSGLSRGTHTFTVRATDAAGNTGEDEFTWTISNPAPPRGPPAAAAGEEQAAAPPAQEPPAGGDQQEQPAAEQEERGGEAGGEEEQEEQQEQEEQPAEEVQGEEQAGTTTEEAGGEEEQPAVATTEENGEGGGEGGESDNSG